MKAASQLGVYNRSHREADWRHDWLTGFFSLCLSVCLFVCLSAFSTNFHFISFSLHIELEKNSGYRKYLSLIYFFNFFSIDVQPRLNELRRKKWLFFCQKICMNVNDNDQIREREKEKWKKKIDLLLFPFSLRNKHFLSLEWLLTNTVLEGKLLHQEKSKNAIAHFGRN